MHRTLAYLLASLILCATSALWLACGDEGSPPSSETGLPELVDAKAPSRHYVEVTFAKPAGDAARDPNNYIITGPGSSRLSVDAVDVLGSGTRVRLTTAAQNPVLYTLAVPDGSAPAGAADPSEGVNVTASALAEGAVGQQQFAMQQTTFAGSPTSEPFLASAIAIANDAVLLRFSDQMDDALLADASLYRIEDPDGDLDVDIRITGVVPDADDTSVVVNTTAQENRVYRIVVAGLESKNGFLIDPTWRAAAFSGLPPDDTQGPQLVGAASVDGTTLVLTFSEPLDDDAADPVNFGVTCGAPECDKPELLVLDAHLAAHNTQVVLTTHPQQEAVDYSINVTNTTGEVTDLAQTRNPIDTSASSTGFSFPGQTAVTSPNTRPRVVGAASTGNSAVVVSFSKPMGDSALVASNYVIIDRQGLVRWGCVTPLRVYGGGFAGRRAL